MSQKRGFLFSLEAALSFMLLLVSLPLLALFSHSTAGEADFFLCSDAAAIIAKSKDFEEQTIREKIDKIHPLSDLCIEVKTAQIGYSSCSHFKEEKTAFTFPIWQSGSLENATISCWRPEQA